MCYYNRLIVPVHQAFSIGEFPVEWPDELITSRPVQSGFEFGDWPIIIWSEEKQSPEMVKGHWEFLAPWTKSLKAAETSRQQYTTLNAVGEKLFESRLYKEAAQKRRCLVLSSGFYEWRHWKPTGAKKDLAIPYLVYLPGQPVFFMAGVWQPWTDQDTGEHLNSFAIVTTASNSLMAQVHNTKKRMPLILTDELAWKWIDPSLPKKEIGEIAAYKYDTKKMEAYTIVKDFRTAPDPSEPMEYEGLPEITN
jgi:putative SOS response-associated peptidase YedK